MVARKGKLVYSDAMGFQDKGSSKPMALELLAKLSRYDRLAACQARAVRASAAVCEFDLVVPVIFRRI
jgi:hypothetical protein